MKSFDPLPKITVIVPNFNDSRFIKQCLESIIHQSIPPDELIVIDDASTDNSVFVIKKLLDNCNFAILIENKINLGVYGAVEIGLQKVTNNYVLFLSANDFLMPNIFKYAKESIAKYPNVGLWSSLGWLVDEDDIPLKILPQAVISLSEKYFSADHCNLLAQRFGNWFVGTSVIYNRSLLHEIDYFDPKFFGLADLISSLIVASRQGAIFCPVPLAVCRIHSNSFLSSTLSNENLFINILNHLSEKGPKCAPNLFTPNFLNKTKLRFIFSVIHKSRGYKIVNYLNFTHGFQNIFLKFIDVFISKNYEFIRIFFSFIILRFFDIFVTLFYRYFLMLYIKIKYNKKSFNKIS